MTGIRRPFLGPDRVVSSREAFLTGSLAFGSLLAAAGTDALALPEITLTAALKQRVRRLATASKVPGVAVASVFGKRIDSFGIGMAHNHDQTTASTVFEAASLSKPAFALGVLQLVEAGKLHLDSPIATIVDLRHETDDPRVLRITPRHALTHTTGLPNWRFKPGPLRCKFEPGSRFSYSGEGIFLLQRAVEHVVGTGLAYYMRQHVLEPLGMTSSTFAFTTSIETKMASPHDVSGRNSEWRALLLGRQLVALAGSRGLPLEKWTWNDMRSVLPKLEPPQKPLPVYSTINAASSLLTTAQDYANVASALARQPKLTSPQIAVTDRIAWGLGVGLELSKDRTAFHWGDNDGFKAMLVADTRRPDGAIVLTNSDGGMKLALKAIERLIGPSHPLLGWVGAMYG